MARPPFPPWRIIPRPLLETILNNHAHHHRVPNLLLLHGPRGAGKTSLLLHRLLPSWSQPPHFTAFVDLCKSPSWLPSSTPPSLPSLQSLLSGELESLAHRAAALGALRPRDVFNALHKWHGLRTALRRVAGCVTIPERGESEFKLWSRAVLAVTHRIGGEEVSGLEGKGKGECSVEEAAFVREAVAALRVAKEVVEMQCEWRREAVRSFNRKGGGFSRSLVNSSTDWVCFLVEILSEAAEVDFFQPKLVINNIDVLRKATTTDESTIPAGMYHDSFIWRLIALGVNERCLPIILATSDSYYSYQASIDFGFPDIFISRETFGWTPQEAKLHMVSDFFSEPEWKVIEEVLGPNPRHISELYALKQSAYYPEVVQGNNFEDIVDAYIAYLQVTVVNPAMESALAILRNFASDVRNGKIPEDQLYFGAPWRHPPHTDDPAASFKWAKIQLIDFVQSLVNTEFGASTGQLSRLPYITLVGPLEIDICAPVICDKVNYLADYSFEILNDPAAVALTEVGLLYTQRDPSFIRPITRGIQRCLARWLVQERMQMSLSDSIPYLWQRLIRGRSYRHLMIK